jgi:glucose-1-phosphate adenylyltransferase
MRETMAVFLAGGRGRGLGVLSEHRATAALPFAGKYRLVDFSLSNCHYSGIWPVALLTQHAPTSLREHVHGGRAWDLDRAEGGILTLQPFARRERAAWYTGAADALLRNLSTYADSGAQRLLVGSAEHVYLMDYSELLASHLDARCPVTAAVTPARPEQVRRRHMVEVRGDRVQRFEHYPERTDLTLAAMGLYVFEMEFLRAEAADGPRRSLRDLLEPALARGIPVNAFRFGGFWEDVRDLETYYRTSMAFLAPEPPLLLGDPQWPVETRGEERAPAVFAEGSRARSSLIAGGAVVEGEVENSILFGGVVVEHGARVKDSILLQDAHIGAEAVLDRAILDKQVGVGEGAVLGDGPLPPPGGGTGLCVVGKEARLPAGYRLPRGAAVGVGADLTKSEILREFAARPAGKPRP